MFTGLVEALGSVVAVQECDASRDLTIVEPTIAKDLPIGASVAVNGVCLTVVAVSEDGFRFQAGPETLRLTNLGELRVGDRVNLERSLRLGDRLGGHLVQGHVDGLGRVERRERTSPDWETVWFRCPVELARQMVPKGSVAVDGVSLTIVDVFDSSLALRVGVSYDGFSVALIPHTLAATTLGFKGPGDSVNLESDIFGKYVWKYMSQRSP